MFEAANDANNLKTLVFQLVVVDGNKAAMTEALLVEASVNSLAKVVVPSYTF